MFNFKLQLFNTYGNSQYFSDNINNKNYFNIFLKIFF